MTEKYMPKTHLYVHLCKYYKDQAGLKYCSFPEILLPVKGGAYADASAFTEPACSSLLIGKIYYTLFMSVINDCYIHLKIAVCNIWVCVT